MSFQASGKKKKWTKETTIILEHGTSTVKVLAVRKDDKSSCDGEVVAAILKVAPILGRHGDATLFGMEAVTKCERKWTEQVFNMDEGCIKVTAARYKYVGGIGKTCTCTRQRSKKTLTFLRVIHTPI